MHRQFMALTRRCAIVLSGGAGWAYLIRYSARYREKRVVLIPYKSIGLTSRHIGLHVRLQKGDVPPHIGRTKGGLNSKLHAVVDGRGKPLVLPLSAGQVSDHSGAKIVYPALRSGYTDC